jgi:hypothetical protein
MKQETKNKRIKLFQDHILSISEEKNDFNIARQEFEYISQIKPTDPVKSHIFDKPDKIINWGTLFYNTKTNTPFIASTKTQYLIRDKGIIPPRVRQKGRNGDGRSSKVVNESLYNKLNNIYKTIEYKTIENFDEKDKKNLIKLDTILNKVNFDVTEHPFLLLELGLKVIQLKKQLNMV